MAEPVQEATPPPGEDDTQAQQPALPTEQEGAAPSPAAAAAADPTTPVDTDQELEQALRAALAGPAKDLGLLCKTLGDRFCLEPRRSRRKDTQAVCDSGSDTTSPADQEPSSSETDGDSNSASGSGGGSSSSSSSSTAERESREDDLQAVSAAAKISADLLSSAWSALSAWREAISEGDLLDVFNSMEGEWYLGKVLHTVDEEEEGGEGKPELQAMEEVKEWIREDEFGNIVARGIVGEDDPYDPKVFDRKKAEVEGEAEEKNPVPVEGATTNRYGRVVVPRVNLATPKGKGKAKDPNGDGGVGGGDDAECNEGEGEGEGGTADGESGNGKKRTNRKALVAEGGGAVNSADDWICAVCSQLDTPCMSDMVTCDGPCLRSFHVVCLDLGEDALKEEKWLCEDCERGEHE
ncbi:unnamed protein product [Ectocarpus sp. CCAP 1310/34]|nr:unnamed protein product [Ectocarpus sp. CCAP 1310/34]